LARLRYENCPLLDSVGSLADRVYHERMWTDAEFLSSIDYPLLEFIGKLE